MDASPDDFFFFKQKTAYEITRGLEFRRVLFRSELGVGRFAHPPTPLMARKCLILDAASSGSRSKPAASARRKVSARSTTERADCWPPTMTKCSWWPFNHARNARPVL